MIFPVALPTCRSVQNWSCPKIVSVVTGVAFLALAVFATYLVASPACMPSYMHAHLISGHAAIICGLITAYVIGTGLCVLPFVCSSYCGSSIDEKLQKTAQYMFAMQKALFINELPEDANLAVFCELLDLIGWVADADKLNAEMILNTHLINLKKINQHFSKFDNAVNSKAVSVFLSNKMYLIKKGLFYILLRRFISLARTQCIRTLTLKQITNCMHITISTHVHTWLCNINNRNELENKSEEMKSFYAVVKTILEYKEMTAREFLGFGDDSPLNQKMIIQKYQQLCICLNKLQNDFTQLKNNNYSETRQDQQDDFFDALVECLYFAKEELLNSI